MWVLMWHSQDTGFILIMEICLLTWYISSSAWLPLCSCHMVIWLILYVSSFVYILRLIYGDCLRSVAPSGCDYQCVTLSVRLLQGITSFVVWLYQGVAFAACDSVCLPYRNWFPSWCRSIRVWLLYSMWLRLCIAAPASLTS